MVARGFQSASHPILAQIVPIRRCNLACTYCNEFDKHSPPVPLPAMRERIDHLARLRTANIEISGGEPLLHPDLDELIRHIRGTGAMAGLITNGYLLSEKRIEGFNDAGLDHLQISIDNVTPDDVSKKSLKVLDAKLQMLAKHAAFSVNINSVLGAGLSHPEDALTITEGEDLLILYEWNTRRAKHYFCRICGLYVFHRKRAAPDHFGVNIFCLDDFDPGALPVRATDGATMSVAVADGPPEWLGPRAIG